MSDNSSDVLRAVVACISSDQSPAATEAAMCFCMQVFDLWLARMCVRLCLCSVCVCVYIYIYIYAHTHVCKHFAWSKPETNKLEHCIYIYIYTRTHTYVYTHTRCITLPCFLQDVHEELFAYTYIHTYIYIYTHTYIHIHTYIYTHTHTHTHT